MVCLLGVGLYSTQRLSAVCLAAICLSLIVHLAMITDLPMVRLLVLVWVYWAPAWTGLGPGLGLGPFSGLFGRNYSNKIVCP